MRRLLLIVVVCAFALAACGSGKKTAAAKTDDKPAQTTTTKPASPPVAPLTGLPSPMNVANTRCVVTVKIDNTTASQPKSGIDQADVVWEEVVEYNITRLAAMFNSQAPTQVGKVRSVRKTDQALVWPVKGVFAYSGGAPYAVESISTAPVVQLDENRAGSMMFRDHSHSAPYNLYAHVDQMYSACKSPAPQPLFLYRAKGDAVTGDPASTATVAFKNGYAVTWKWNPTAGGWTRSIFGRPEVVNSGATLEPKNVVVMTVQYVGGDPRPEHLGVGAEAQLVGTGPLQVFTAGKVIKGTWSRADKEHPAKLLDATGTEIKLTPGQTWVELPEPDMPTTSTP
jgi:Protein of unknown function (DUF3048) N-terminal domain/Protein of unknown function (DUF3048) C-terminal domain